MAIRVVIIGGGFGGLEAAFALKALGRPRFEISLVDRSASHAFIPSIHLVISGKVKSSEIQLPLGPVLRAAGIGFVQAEVSGIARDRREVIAGERAIPYDYCIIGCGATNNFLSVPGAEQFACRFRTPADAEKIRSRLLELLRNANSPCRIAVAGAGTEGVELIGEVLDLIRSEAFDRDLQQGRITLALIEGKTSPLPGFPRSAGTMVENRFRQRGVEIIAGDRIAEVRSDSLLLNSGRVVEVSMLIWSAGIQPGPLVGGLDLPKDPWGWLRMTDLLNSPGDDHVYGIGDAVSIYTADGPMALQRLAYHAQDQARVAALNIAAAAGEGRPVRYEPKNKPQLISIGSNQGIFSAGDRVLSGPWVVALKKAVEQKHLFTYLAKPFSSTLSSLLPGAGIVQRLRTRLPL